LSLVEFLMPANSDHAQLRPFERMMVVTVVVARREHDC
jgi:hypothetical protein